ncbi:ankyrin repeat and LEM domain-containing protein 1 isoform X2 [Petaurus breviceps papuanus]|uniref:ankyrin repeat and LEM domain-containing protein 1 isoform X2 n=1 Tax=Petaurus breviceps papuanus TaxID=3040969 RepID=UPI0036DA8BD8
MGQHVWRCPCTRPLTAPANSGAAPAAHAHKAAREVRMAAMEPWTADRTEDSAVDPGSAQPGRGTSAAARGLGLARRLREALHYGQARQVESLLRLGADPNLVLPDGVAAVHLAAGSERDSGLRCLALLLQYGADPNARSEDALTPVHVAASWGCYKCLELLLREGGDPELQDQDGTRALDLALEQGNEECIEILRKHAPPYPTLCRGEDQGNGFSALNGDDLDTSIWGFSDVTFSPRPLGSIVRAHLDGSEVESEALEAGHTLPSQTLSAHPRPSHGKGLGADKPSEPDFGFPARFFLQPTSPLSPASRLGSAPHLVLDDISLDHCCHFHSGPDCSCGDQDETAPSCLPADTGTSSSDSFLTAVETFGPDTQPPSALPTSPITPDATGAVPSQPRKGGSGSQPGSMTGTSATQIAPLDMCFPDSRTPQKSGPLRKDLAYAALRAELRAMILNAGHSQTTLDDSGMLAAAMDPVIHLNAQLRGLVLGPPLEPQDFVHTRTPCKPQGMFSHNGEGNSSSLSDKNVEQGPSLKRLPGKCGPDSMNNESPREGKYLTLDSSEQAGAIPFTTQTSSLVAFTEDVPFNDFLTDDKTSQSSEDGASMWLTEDGEDEEDHIPQNLKASPCWNCIRKSPEPPRGSPILNPPLHPLQPSGPKPTGPLHADPKAGPSFLDQHLLHAEDTVTNGQCSCHPSTPFPPRDPSTLSNQELLQHLQAPGESPGPVTPFTRQYYLKQLKEGSPRGPTAAVGYSPELTLALKTGCVPNAQDDEDVLAQQFDQPDPTQRWREGIVKSSFTYLLLDPRVTQNLPSRCHILSPAECFQTFTHAIFYVDLPQDTAHPGYLGKWPWRGLPALLPERHCGRSLYPGGMPGGCPWDARTLQSEERTLLWRGSKLATSSAQTDGCAPVASGFGHLLGRGREAASAPGHSSWYLSGSINLWMLKLGHEWLHLSPETYTSKA